MRGGVTVEQTSTLERLMIEVAGDSKDLEQFLNEAVTASKKTVDTINKQWSDTLGGLGGDFGKAFKAAWDRAAQETQRGTDRVGRGARTVTAGLRDITGEARLLTQQFRNNRISTEEYARDLARLQKELNEVGKGTELTRSETIALGRANEQLAASFDQIETKAIADLRNEVHELRGVAEATNMPTRELVENFRDVQQRALEMAEGLETGNKAKRDLSGVAATAGRSVKTLEGELTRLGFSGNNYVGVSHAIRDEWRGMETQLTSLQSTMGPLTRGGGLLGLLLGGAAGAAGIAGITRFVQQTTELASTIDVATFRVGVSAETYQALAFAAQQVNVESAILETTLQRLQRRAADAAAGNAGLLKAFNELGVTLRDQVTGEMLGTEDLLAQVADGLAGVENNAERLRLAFKIFDTEGARLLPLLAGGSEGIRQLKLEAEAAGAVVSGAALDALNAYGSQVDELQAQLRTARTTMLSMFVPALESGTEAVQNATRWWSNLDGETQKLIVQFGVASTVFTATSGLLLTLVANANRLRAAYVALRAAMLASPWGWVALGVSALAGLAAQFVLTRDRADSFADEMSVLDGTATDLIRTLGGTSDQSTAIGAAKQLGEVIGGSTQEGVNTAIEALESGILKLDEFQARINSLVAGLTKALQAEADLTREIASERLLASGMDFPGFDFTELLETDPERLLAELRALDSSYELQLDHIAGTVNEGMESINREFTEGQEFLSELAQGMWHMDPEGYAEANRQHREELEQLGRREQALLANLAAVRGAIPLVEARIEAQRRLNEHLEVTEDLFGETEGGVGGGATSGAAASVQSLSDVVQKMQRDIATAAQREAHNIAVGMSEAEARAIRLGEELSAVQGAYNTLLTGVFDQVPGDGLLLQLRMEVEDLQTQLANLPGADTAATWAARLGFEMAEGLKTPIQVIRILSPRLQELIAERDELLAAGQFNTTAYQELEAKIQAITSTVEAAETAIDGLMSGTSFARPDEALTAAELERALLQKEAYQTAWQMAEAQLEYRDSLFRTIPTLEEFNAAFTGRAEAQEQANAYMSVARAVQEVDKAQREALLAAERNSKVLAAILSRNVGATTPGFQPPSMDEGQGSEHTDVWLRLREDMKLAEAQASALGDQFDLNAAQSQAISRALTALLAAGVDPLSVGVQNLVADLADLAGAAEAVGAAEEAQKLLESLTEQVQQTTDARSATEQLRDALIEYGEANSDAADEVAALIAQLDEFTAAEAAGEAQEQFEALLDEIEGIAREADQFSDLAARVEEVATAAGLSEDQVSQLHAAIADAEARTAVQELADAVTDAEDRIRSLTGTGETEFDVLRTVLETARDALLALGEDVTHVDALLKQLGEAEAANNLVGTLGTVRGAFQQIGSAAGGAAGEAITGIGDMIDIAMKFASGDVAGAVIDIFAEIVRAISEVINANENWRRSLDDLEIGRAHV